MVEIIKPNGRHYDPNNGEVGAAIYGRTSSDEEIPIKVVDDGSGLGEVVLNGTITGGAGTEYTEGATDSSITGTAVMLEKPLDTLSPAQADQLGPLRVALKTTSEVINGDFEDGVGALPDYWSARADSGDVVPTWDTTNEYSGAKCIKFAPSGADVAGQIYQSQKIDVSTLNAVQAVCFSKVVTTGGGAATCNFGVQVLFYDEQDNLIQTVGTLYARNSTSHGTYAATQSTAIFTVTTGAVKAAFAFGVSAMSSNCEVYIDSFSGYRFPIVQAAGSFGFPVEQVHATVAGTYPAMVASELIGNAVPEHAVVIGVRSTAGNVIYAQGFNGNADNVTAPAGGNLVGVADFGFVYDGSTWDRAPGNSTDGTLVNLGANNDVVDTAAEASLAIMDDWDNAASDGASVSGDVAHDSADAGEPVKIGGKAIDMTPDSTGEQGPTAVAANDRVNQLFDLRGMTVEAPNTQYGDLDAIEDTYDNTTTTNTSSAVECWRYRKATISCALTKANTPTDILFEVEVSVDNSVWRKLYNGFLGNWIYDDTAVGSSGINPALTFNIVSRYFRVKVTATGTTASNTFTIADAQYFLQN